eukprot:657728-Prorocentrum_minimum.AAC.1
MGGNLHDMGGNFHLDLRLFPAHLLFLQVALQPLQPLHCLNQNRTLHLNVGITVTKASPRAVLRATLAVTVQSPL